MNIRPTIRAALRWPAVLAALLLVALPSVARADTVFDPASGPGGDAVQDAAIELGMKISPTQDGWITAVRFYKQPNNTGAHVGHLWTAGGQQLAEAAFENETASGWQEQTLPEPVPVTAGTTYVVSYHSPLGRFAFSPGYFSGATIGSGALQAPGDGNGVYRYGATSGFPTDTWNATNYWVDAQFSATPPSDTRAPRVSSVAPTDDSVDVATTVKPSVSFDEPMAAGSFGAGSITMRDDLGATIAASIAYDGATKTATLSPAGALGLGRRYTVTVASGAGGPTDTAGNALASGTAFSFNTRAGCPCSVFRADEAPLGDAVNDAPVELGMKITAKEDGWITALRFYKQPGNTGTHVGHLWTTTGTKLGEVTFENETASGWQVAQLPEAVPIAAGQTLITSYYAAQGRFAFSPGFFGSPLDRAPLAAPADFASGGNGVYRYGASSGFPDQTFGASNYWVDASFERTRPPDSRPPRIASRRPDAGAKRVPTDSAIEVTFDESMDRLTVNVGSILLADNATGTGVAGTVTYDEGSRTARLVPSQPLAFGKTYKVTVKSGTAGVTDVAGNRFANDESWTFSTPSQCPCTIFDPGDASQRPSSPTANRDRPLELGVRFTAAEDGYITALRFYKQSNNTGAHVGHLWSSTGDLLATIPFNAETASGWQNVDLPNPVAVTKDTVYVASYFSPAGYFPFDQGYFGSPHDGGMLTALAASNGGNGVYRYGASSFPDQTFNATNYWVDATFERTVPPDTRGPSVTETTPADGASDIARDATVSATFDEQLLPGSVTSQTFTLRGPDGSPVSATVSYDAQTRGAKLTPDAPLAFQTEYTATLKGGASGIKDASGNPMSADRTVNFEITVQPPSEGPGGPVLLLTDPADKFGTYYAEILRSEGLNEFSVSSVPVTAAKLTGHTTVVLAKTAVTDAEVTTLTNWVQGGGNLIAMRPDKKLAGLLGLADAGGTLANGYLKVDKASAAGAGIDGQTLQYHDTADRYTLAGASAVATLYSTASSATTNPAVSLRSVGTSGGQAAAFTFDLARSVVYTRQGNPAWAGDKRDGLPPLSIRPNDLFYGAKTGDVQPDWVDPNRIDVPQADEQQRLLANLITQMNLDKAPLPRFWYLPRGEKAAIVLTGDDHSVGGTPKYFDRLKAASAAGCSVDDWECIRATSYAFPDTAISAAAAKAYEDEGFEIALHLNTGCVDFTPASLEDNFASQLSAFSATWPSLSPPVSNRTHCIAWSDWATMAKTERRHGIRFDTNYYYKGPASWIKKPALMTGSGFPQRFGDSDGSLIDVYQSMTQVSDEMDEIISTTTQIDTLLENALGPKDYWGVFDVILHSDWGDHQRLNELVGEARRQGVPVVTSAQMLAWLDGRNGSSFGNIAYNGNQLTFTLAAHPSARGLEAMLPMSSATGPLSRLRRDGQPVSWNPRTVKGVQYAVFKAAAGSYTATYAADTTGPDVTAVSATADAEGHATVKWTTDEPSTSVVRYGRTSALGFEQENTAPVTDHAVELTGLQPGTTYLYRVTSADAAGNSTTSPATAASFSTPASTLLDSRTSEFAAGTHSGTYAGDTLVGPDGELQLQPTAGDEFNGPTVPAGWSWRPWRVGGTTAFTGGSLLADGAVTYTDDYFAGPRTLEFSATFDAVNDESVGLGGDLSDFPYAIFTSGIPGDPFGVYVMSGASPEDTAKTELPGVSLYEPHRFRIEWTPTQIRYFVDGALVATHAVSILGEIRPVISDYGLFGAVARVHWLRMTTYPGSGTFTSRVFDSGPGANDWQQLTSTASVPAGTAVSYETRSGDTRQPGATWSAWQAVSAGTIASPNARYLQYRATLGTASGALTPTVRSVQASYGAGADQAPVTGTVTVSPTAPRTNQTITATASGFSDPDGDPLTLRYEWFRNGTLIQGVTGRTLNLSLAGNGDRGDRIRVEAYATDGRGAASDPASAKVTVANTAPTAGTVAIKPLPPSARDLVRAIPSGYADIDGDQLTYTYQWLVNGVAVAGATEKTFDLTGRAQTGDRVDVDVRAVDDGGLQSPAARGGSAITATNATPLDGTVELTPAEPKTNATLTVTPSGFNDPDGDPLTYVYAWSRNGTPIAGETSATLDLSQPGRGDRGDDITVSVRARDPQGLLSDGVTAGTTVVTTDPTAGSVSVRPSDPSRFDTVSAVTTGYADIDGDALSYVYQWSRNGTPIENATGRSLNLAKVDEIVAGDVLRVSARALDGHGGTSPDASGSTTVATGNGHPVASYGFEEATGATAVDQYGGNDAAVNGADRVNNGRFGRALSFEDAGDIAKAPDDSSLHLGTGMTLEAWVKPTATTDWRTVIFREAAGGLDYGLYANDDGDAPHAHIGNNGTSGASGNEELDPNRWTHLAATYDNNILKLYVDGTQVASKALTGDLSEAEGPLSIGANEVWGEEFRGLIDEVRVYNRPLARSEIQADMDLPVTPGTPRPPADTDPDKIGSFAKPTPFPITPVHLSLLRDGRVAMWDGFDAAVNSEHTWDPWTGQIDAIPNGRNLFCAGHITLSDGRLLVAGGHVQAYEGTKDTNLFSPLANTWARGPDMAVARWYPTATTLPDGRVFVVSGDAITLGQTSPGTPVPLINSSDTLPEIYDAATNTWTAVPAAGRRMPLYPHIFVLPDGRLFDAGPDPTTRTLDLQTNTWTTVGTSPIDGQSTIQYRPGKFLKSGTWSEPDFPGRQATNKAAAIDMTAANPAWREVASMKYGRSYHTLTVLPDGKVLATGGQDGTDGVEERTGVLPAEMWDPDTDTWTQMASARRPRLYHSSSILLPDGRVLLAGGGAFGNANNERSGELYSPPYLFKGPRPQISDAPDTVHYGQSFTIDTPDASRIQSVSMVRMGNVTHNVDMDQRFQRLPMTLENGSLRVTGPQNANYAPPGWYMIFVNDDNGVPSHAAIVQVTAAGDTQAPTAPTALGAVARTAGADLSWGAATDNTAVDEYRVYRSTTQGFTPTSANRIAKVPTGTTYGDLGLAAGTYYYRVRAVDKAGNVGPASGEATVTVAADTAAPAVSITAPTGGSVSGTRSITATATDAVGVASVQFKVDGQDIGAADTTSPYQLDWDSRTVSDTEHTLTAVARDPSGNAATSAARTVRVHNTGLVVGYGFEEPTGTTALDPANGWNGTIAGAGRVTDGQFGRALSFDGVDDWVTVADRPEIDLVGGGTVEAWVKPSALGPWRSVLTKEISGQLAYGLFAASGTGLPAGRVFAGSSIAEALAPAPVGIGTWTHLAMSWNQSEVKVYVDGTEMSAQPAVGPIAGGVGPLRIGGNGIFGQYFSGLIDEVRVFDHARTASQITADMNAPVSP